MALSQQEFEDILADGSKEIRGDIRWRDDPAHQGAVEFQAAVHSASGQPLIVHGWWRPLSRKLSYTLMHGTAGRISGLDLGRVSHGISRRVRLRGTHKHRWRASGKAPFAYAPDDITADWDEPLEVWRQFCAETNLSHLGTMEQPAADPAGEGKRP